MRIRLFITVASLFVAATSFAQGLTPPAEGKAVVYFARVSSAGFAISFDFFDGRKYIGDFAGRNYLRYECEPGQHVFWASAENKDFMTAELKAGEIYVVNVDVELGVAIARVGLTPISAGQKKSFERAKKLIDKKAPRPVTQQELDTRNANLADFMEDKMSKYETKWKDERKYKHLSADMAISVASF